MLDVETNESSRISARLSHKGLRILEVRLAIRFLISICISPELSYKSIRARPASILAYGIRFANPPNLPRIDSLDFIRQFTVSLFTIMIEKEFTKLAVEINKASFSYNNIKALNELSLEVPAGISFGLLGPNGAGKTTLLRLLVGLLKPKSGSVQILGQTPSRKTARHIGYMPQLHSLYSELSIIQNVDFFAKIYGLTNKHERDQRVEEALRLVDMWQRRKDSILKLSGGMKQRVSLACAIAHNPPLLFLDEPTVGLDPELRVTFWEHFTTLTRQGVTIIISSHTMDDAAHCDRLAFMRDGKVIAQGTPSELQQATGQHGATLEDAFLFFIHHEDRNDS